MKEDQEDDHDEEQKSQNETLVQTLRNRLHAQYQGSIIPDSLIDTAKVTKFVQKYQRGNPNYTMYSSNINESLPRLFNPSSNVSKVGDMTTRLPPIKINEQSMLMAQTARAGSVVTSAKMELRERESKLYQRKIRREKKAIVLAHGDFINLPDFKGGKQLKAEDFISKIKINPNLVNEFIYCFKGSGFYDFYYAPFKDKFDPKQVDKNPTEYLTISRRGVTHFLNGESTFMSLSDWMNELEKYRRIKKELKFFNQYVVWKNYFLWKKLMKTTKVMERKEELNKNLFLANNILFNQMIGEIRPYAMEISNIDLFNNGQWDMIGLAEYEEEVKKLLDKNINKINKRGEQIIQSIFECCMRSTKEFQENHRIDFKDDEKKGMAPFMVGDETHQDMPYTQEAARRTHYRRLAKFIRMQDMLMMDARRMMIMNSFKLLAESLGYGLNQSKMEVNKKRKSFLRILLTCTDNKIEFNPTQEQLKTCIFELIEKIMENISGIKKYQSDTKFQGYFTALKDEEDTNYEESKLIGDVIREDKAYEISARLIESHVKTVFQQIHEYSKSFSEIINELHQNKKRNFEELKTKDHSVFQEWLNDFKGIDQKIDQIEETYPKGFAIIDCSMLKTKMKSLSSDCLKKMKELIPEYITEEMTTLKTNLHEVYEKCSILIEGLELDEYILKFKYFQEHKDKEQTYSDIIEKSRKIDQYAKEYNLNATDKIKIINDTEKQFSSMRAQLNACLEKCNNKQTFYLRDIDRKYPTIRDGLTEIINDLSSERYMNDKYDKIKSDQEKVRQTQAAAKKDEKKGEKQKEAKETKDAKEAKEATNEKKIEKEAKEDAKKEEAKKEEEKKTESQEQADEKFHTLIIDNVKSIIEYDKKIKQMNKTYSLLKDHEKFLQKEPADLDGFPKAIELHDTNKMLWSGIYQFEIIQAEWNKTPILIANYEAMKEFLNEYSSLLKIIESIKEDKEKTDENVAAKNLETKVASYKAIIPIIHCMQSHSLGLIDKSGKPEIKAKAEQYFSQIKEILNSKHVKDAKEEKKDEFIERPADEKVDYKTLTLQYLLERKNINKDSIKKIEEIKNTAEREMKMEDIYDSIKKKWESNKNFSDSRLNTELPLCQQVCRNITEEINQMMTELNVLTGRKQSQYIKQKVTTLYQSMSELLGHFEDIDFFITQSIKFSKLKIDPTTVTTEKKGDEKESNSKLDFNNGRKEIARILNNAKTFPKMLEFCKEDKGKIREKIANINDTISAYEQYFENYKKTFHRLCLLSTDDLINLFSDQDLMHALLIYLPELFSNIKDLIKGEDDIIEKAVSKEGEAILVHLTNIKKISVTQNEPSKVFANIYEYAKGSIITSIKTIKEKFEKNDNIDRCEIIKDTSIASQAVLFYDSFLFSYGMEFLMQEEDSYEQNFNEWKIEIGGIIGALLKLINEKATLPYQRKTAINLILQQLHYSEIIESICLQQIHEPSDFRWQQYTRFKYEEYSPLLYIGQSTIEYGYEFMGSPSHIQLIPQTERCFLSVSQALKSKQGVLMAGNSGEGKLETIKELARTCAKFFIEFTCSTNTPIYALQNVIFSSVFIGFNIAWLALRHIDLLSNIPLSVIAQDLNSIRQCTLTNRPITIGNKTEEEQSKDAPFKRTSVPIYFATLKDCSISPAVIIPSQLKEYFRPVYVTNPDFAEIIKIPLYSHGVNNFDQIGDKMALLFKIAPSMLSSQPSYEFTYRKVHDFNKEVDRLLTLENEPILTVIEKAISNIVLPSLLKPDMGIFISIFNNIFGTRDTFKRIEKSSIFPEYEKFYTKDGNQIDEFYLQKTYEVYQSIMNMGGAFIIGNQISGKSTIVKGIIKFVNYTNQLKSKELVAPLPVINAITLYPNAYSPGVLLGKSASNIQWEREIIKPLVEKDSKDDKGILKDYLSKTCETKDCPTWLVFDGDIQLEESDMISQLLDAHPKICMGNGLVMSPKSELKLIFENNDVSCYSPNILYKAGIIHIFPDRMNWKKYIDDWLNSMETKYKTSNANADSYFNPKMKELLGNLMGKMIPTGLEKREAILRYYSVEPIIYLCKLIESLYSPIFYVSDDKPMESRFKILERIFSYAYMWAFTTGMTKNDSKRFEKETQNSFNAGNLPKGAGGILSIFDHFPDIKHNDKFGDFKACAAKKMVYFTNQSNHTVFIHTKESYTLHMINKICMYGDIDVWFEGQENIGKTSSILQSLAKLKASRNPNQIAIDYIYYTILSCTTPEALQASIDKKLDKKKRNLFDGLNGKKAVIFIDDLHIGSLRMWEYARMLTTEKGFYNKEPTYWKQITNTSMIICSNSSTQKYNKRLRLFKIRSEPLSDDVEEETFRLVFEDIYVRGKYPEEMKEVFVKISTSIKSIYKNIKEDLKAEPKDITKRFGIGEAMRVAGEFLLTDLNSLASKDEIEYLWANQTLREYGDRLTKENDIKILADTVATKISTPKKTDILFTDITGKYQMVESFDNLKNAFLGKIKDFLISEALDIYICQDFIINVAKIHRCFLGKRRNVILTGPDSIARKTFLKIVAFLKGFKMEVHTGKEPLVAILNSTLKAKASAIIYINIPTHLSEHDSQIISLLYTHTDHTLVLNDDELSIIYDKKLEKGEKPIDADQQYENFVNDAPIACHFAFSGDDSDYNFVHFLQKSPAILKSSSIIAIKPFPEAVLKELAHEMIAFQKKDIPEIVISAFHDLVIGISKIDKRLYSFKMYFDSIKLYTSLINERETYIDSRLNKLNEVIRVWTECGRVYLDLKEKLENLKGPVIPKTEVSEEEEKNIKEQFVKQKKEMEERKIVNEKFYRLFYSENSDDEKRWNGMIDELKKDKERLYGDAFIMATMLNYGGVFTSCKRLECMSLIKKILDRNSIKYNPDFKPYEFISNKTLAQKWIGDVFPNEDYCILNALIALYGPRRPMICDKYRLFTKKLIEKLTSEMNIKARESSSYVEKPSLSFLSQHDNTFFHSLNHAMVCGGVIIVDDVNYYLDPRLRPLLLNQTYTKPSDLTHKYIRIAKEEYELSKNFVIVFISNLDASELPTEMVVNCSVINIDYDTNIMTEVFLNEICKKNIDDSAYYRSMIEIENKMIDHISKHKMRIVDSDNSKALDYLDTEKAAYGKATNNFLNEQNPTTKDLRRDQYKNVAMLFQYMCKISMILQGISPIYATTHSNYVKGMLSIINNIDPSQEAPPDNTRDNVYAELNKYIYQEISTKLLHKHRLLFKFLLSSYNLITLRTIREAELIIVIKGIPGFENIGVPTVEMATKSVNELISMFGEPYASVMVGIKANTKLFNDWVLNYDLDHLYPPKELIASLDKKRYSEAFTELVLIKICKPSAINWAIRKFSDNLCYPPKADQDEIDNAKIDAKLEVKTLDCRTPWIIVCNKDVDPIAQVLEWLPATKERENTEMMKRIWKVTNLSNAYMKQMVNISLSSTQLIIKSLHLIKNSVDALKIIYKIINHKCKDQIDKEFRLVIITEETNAIPRQFACSSKKFIIKNCKTKLEKQMALINSIPENSFPDNKAKKMVFSLSLLHSMLNMRCKFNFTLWSKYFNYSNADFTSSYSFLHDCFNYEKVSFDSIIQQFMSTTYGNLMKTEADKQVLYHITQNYINERIFTEPKYIFSDSQKYYIPEPSNYTEFGNKLKEFPPMEYSDLFKEGKAEALYYQTNKSNSMMKKLIECVETVHPKKRDLYTAVFDLLEKLPSKILELDVNEHTRSEITPVKNSISPLNACLFQEIQKANNIVTIIKSDLELVKTAINDIRLDLIPASMSEALYANTVPAHWASLHFDSPTLSAFIEGIIERVEYLRSWAKEPKNYFWMGGMFYPQSLITAIKLASLMKKISIEIDSELTQFNEPSEIAVPLENAFYLYGLYIKNAKISESSYSLDDNKLTSSMNKLPIVCLMPVPSIEEVEGMYNCPVLMSQHRDIVNAEKNYIMSIRLTTEVIPEYWTIKGVSIICNKN